MSEKLIKKEFDKVMPFSKENAQEYRKTMVEKYGEERVKELDEIAKILQEVLSEVLGDILK